MKILIEESVLRQVLDALEVDAAPSDRRIARESLRSALDNPTPPTNTDEPKCNPHPDAPHGFCRDASHSLGRYVCECEGWEPPDSELREAARAVVEFVDTFGAIMPEEIDRLRNSL